VVLNADYMEETPLGRAEWIKFTAAFFDKEAEADSVFGKIEENYLNLITKVQQLTALPTVYTGIVYGDVWYQPGGKSYAAQFIKDAAGSYVWSHNKESGSLALNFEEVYAQAHGADYWIGVGSYNSLAEIRAQDPRYEKFGAFKEGNVYNYNARIGATGGNEFLELGYARPDMVLADLLHILHPELFPEHQLYFYKKLN
ncbi:MAG: ABC transporter substrate-binding protein, partial [Cyclobacteriaceae bacterium]